MTWYHSHLPPTHHGHYSHTITLNYSQIFSLINSSGFYSMDVSCWEESGNTDTTGHDAVKYMTQRLGKAFTDVIYGRGRKAHSLTLKGAVGENQHVSEWLPTSPKQCR